VKRAADTDLARSRRADDSAPNESGRFISAALYRRAGASPPIRGQLQTLRDELRREPRNAPQRVEETSATSVRRPVISSRRSVSGRRTLPFVAGEKKERAWKKDNARGDPRDVARKRTADRSRDIDRSRAVSRGMRRDFSRFSSFQPTASRRDTRDTGSTLALTGSGDSIFRRA